MWLVGAELAFVVAEDEGEEERSYTVIGDETRVEAITLDGGEVQRFEQTFTCGTQGEIRFDIDHIPLHVAALDHGLELAIVGGAVLDHADLAAGTEGLGPRLLLRILGGTAPADEVQAIGGQGGLAGQCQQAGSQHCACAFGEQHRYALVSCVLSGLCVARLVVGSINCFSVYGISYYGIPNF
ncbi:hypothetical protein D3C79_743860 [compost metagenome]